MLLYRIQDHIKPLNDLILVKNHDSPYYQGPDFLHPSYAPHVSFGSSSYWLQDPEATRTGKPTPLPHYHRARDFLAMAPSSWSDITIYLADVFAGFYGYGVQWQPVTRYSTTAPPFSSDLFVVDFALVVRPVPPTTDWTIHRCQSMPLTVSSPAVLLGVHSKCTDGDGSCLTGDDLLSLSKAMEPHLRVFHLHRRHPGVIIPPDTATIPDDSTLFCTYVKPGFVHILAFSLANEEDATVACHIIDSLPVVLSCENDEDLLDRMRIVLALFTLQRQIIKICEMWSMICWPADIMDDEHETIMEMTGISTPTWSVDLPPRDSEEWDMMDWNFGFDIEEEPANSQRRVKASCERVKQWFAKVEPTDGITLQ
ncbi:hypothetical protein EIP86_007585 [Pleurotus ostreatoroseus]|nr:hypothetical protein EIP86_007585 [Pleurotus ostreatoroseus]